MLTTFVDRCDCQLSGLVDGLSHFCGAGENANHWRVHHVGVFDPSLHIGNLLIATFAKWMAEVVTDGGTRYVESAAKSGRLDLAKKLGRRIGREVIRCEFCPVQVEFRAVVDE